MFTAKCLFVLESPFGVLWGRPMASKMRVKASSGIRPQVASFPGALADGADNSALMASPVAINRVV